MTSPTRNLLRTSAALLLALPAFSAAQTVFPETEPNSSYNTGNAVNCLNPGDQITGTTTGTTYGAGLTTVDTYDSFTVRPCTLPTAIYRHKLLLSSPVLGQTVGMYSASEAVGTGCGTAGAPGTNLYANPMSANNEYRWDGFGFPADHYMFVRGSPGTTAPYTLTFSSTTITPTLIGPYSPGSITITTEAQPGNPTPFRDTKIIVYDSNLLLVPGFMNDETCPANASGGSTLTRTFTPGTYFMAVGSWDLIVGQFSSADDNAPTVGSDVAFFTGSLFEDGTAGPVNFSVQDVVGTTPITATMNFNYDVRWFTFTVSPVSTGTLFCVPGSVTPLVMACPCGNTNGANKGCANAGPGGGGNPGASLSAAGSASLAANSTDPGSLTLTGTNMFAGTACIFIQGSAIVGGGSIAFGAGVRCVGGILVRLYVKTGLDVAGGTMTAPTGADRSIPNKTTDLFPAFPIVPGTYYYQCYYRDPGLVPPTPGAPLCPPNFTFNISSGQAIVWTP